MNQITESFRAAISQAFGKTPHNIIHTGVGEGISPQRFSTSNNPQDLTGWYFFNAYAKPPFAIFGDWREGTKHTWAYNRPLTRDQHAELAKNRIEAQQKAEQAKAEKLQKIRRQRQLWAQAKPANKHHPYLVRKQVSAYGLKQQNNTLLVPLRNIGGSVQGIQHIKPDGTKRIHGKLSGLFHHIGKVTTPCQTIYIAEGYATAATIYECTGQSVVMAFTTSNLIRVGLLIRQKYRQADLVFAADNDVNTKAGQIDNPGVHYARKAAKAVHGSVVIPNTDYKADFNDLALEVQL